jgi:predicted hydrolase (HD superfamily)
VGDRRTVARFRLRTLAVNRDDITRGAADLGVDLDEHIQFVIDALAGIADDLGFAPS